MKKIIVAILMCVLVFSFGACGIKKESSKAPENDNLKENENIVESEDENNAVQEDQDDSDIPVIYKIPGEEIYINVPNYQEIEKGYTEVFVVHGQKYVAITAAFDSQVSAVEEGHTVVFDIFKDNIQSISLVNREKIEITPKKILPTCQ